MAILIQTVSQGHFAGRGLYRPKVMKALGGSSASPSPTARLAHREEGAAGLSERLTGYQNWEYFRPNFFVSARHLPVHCRARKPWIFKAASRSPPHPAITYAGVRAHRARGGPGHGGISRFGEIRAQGSRLEQARQHQELYRSAQLAAEDQHGPTADQRPALCGRR